MILSRITPDSSVTSWKRFEKIVRPNTPHLLGRLDDFPFSILVTGCQRSGTTLLTSIISQSSGIVNYQFGHDSELDGALILAGVIDHAPRGRYCFQTTYLNNAYKEYFRYTRGHRIIWVLRDPVAVVYSILYNWRRGALNRLFKSCGTHLLTMPYQFLYSCFGILSVSRIRRACLSYKGKTSQLFELKSNLPDGNLLVIDYEDMITHSKKLLSALFRHIDLDYKTDYGAPVHSNSLKKGYAFSDKKKALIRRLCMPVYIQAAALKSSL